MSTLSRLASLLLLTALVPVGHAAYPDDLRLMTHNVYMLSTNLYPSWGQNYRAGLIASADYIKNQDVVILNEAFDNAASVTLLNGLASQYPYQTPGLGVGMQHLEVTPLPRQKMVAWPLCQSGRLRKKYNSSIPLPVVQMHCLIRALYMYG